MSEEKKKYDEVTYIGRRFQKGKLQHCFTEDGATVWWPKAKAAYFWGIQIGGIYKLDDGRMPDSWTKAKIGQADQADADAWQVIDRAQEMKDRDRKLTKSPDLDHIVERLRDARARLTPVQKVSFDAWLLGVIR